MSSNGGLLGLHPLRVVVFGLPVAAFLFAVGAAVARSSNDDRAPVAAPMLAVKLKQGSLAAPAAPLQVAVQPAAPTETAANRADCASIRGSAYLSDVERDWFLTSCPAPTAAPPPAPTPGPVGSSISSPQSIISVAPAAQSAAAPSASEIYGTYDRLVIKRLGVNAPVNVRVVGPDGVLGNPLGANDVVLYDFSGVPGGLGGYPGKGGNTVIAGHVDYICCLAVFAPLRNVQEGDLIDYYAGDGDHMTYSVQWYNDFPDETNWNSLITGGNDVLTLFTCNGTFDTVAHNYDHRRVVRAVRVQ